MSELNELSGDKQRDIEEKLFYKVASELLKYFKLRILYIPLFIAIGITIAAFLGLSSWIRSIAEDVIQEEAGEYLEQAKIKMDSLTKEAEELSKFSSKQLDVFIRQFDLILPLIASRSDVIRDANNPAPEIITRFNLLKQGEGLHLKFQRIDKPDKFEIYLYRQEKVYMAIEIPLLLVAAHFEELQEISFMAGMIKPKGDPLLKVRAEANFTSIDIATKNIEKLIPILFEADMLYTLESAFLRKK